MNMTTAITCFFKKCLAAGEIPFTLTRQSKHERLLAAFKKSLQGRRGGGAARWRW